MSHFSVLIIGENPELQLAPYQENNMGDCPQEYLKFNPVENLAKYTDEYELEQDDRVVSPDGKYFNEYDRKVNPLPDGYQLVSVPYKKVYLTFDAFMLEYHGYKKDPNTGEFGYYENPNAKWDWYELGGRWEGFFKLKQIAYTDKPVSTVSGRKIQLDNNVTPLGSIRYQHHKDGHVSAAFLGDIDIEGMRDEAEQKARVKYRDLRDLYDGEIPKLDITWAMMMQSPYDHLSIDEKRNMYHNQAAFLKRAKMCDKKEQDHKRELLFEDLEKYQCSEDEYALAARKKAIVTFAVLKDGVWYQRGDMGWWGCVSNEKDEDVWRDEYFKLIDGLSPATFLSVYDCHI